MIIDVTYRSNYRVLATLILTNSAKKLRTKKSVLALIWFGLISSTLPGARCVDEIINVCCCCRWRVVVLMMCREINIISSPLDCPFMTHSVPNLPTSNKCKWCGHQVVIWWESIIVGKGLFNNFWTFLLWEWANETNAILWFKTGNEISIYLWGWIEIDNTCKCW